ncbi:MAG: hypothetical protein NUV47_01695 [Patescibacteria group bacterium]|nr:hypothetical protein [Patescibacteria group bacterium]
MYTNLTIKKLPHSEVEIKGDIPFEELIIHKKKVLKHLGEHVKIDGFREGYIPEKVLEKHVSEITILGEMAELAIANAYPKIVYDNKIIPISRPNVSFTKLAPNNPLGFVINVAVMPEIKLPDYKAMTVDSSLLETIVKETEMEIPKVLVENELSRMLELFKIEIIRNGGTLEKYLEHVKKSEEEIKNDWMVNAEKKVKTQLILNKIAVEEKIEAPKEEMEKEIENIMSQYKEANPERVKDYVEMAIINEKVLKLLGASPVSQNTEK